MIVLTSSAIADPINVRPIAPLGDNDLKNLLQNMPGDSPPGIYVSGPLLDPILDQSTQAVFSGTASGGSIATLIVELTSSSATNRFGLYDFSDPSKKVEIFTGVNGPGSQTVISFFADGTVAVFFVDSGVTGFSGSFGFYIDVFEASVGAGGDGNPATFDYTVYTEDSLNPDGFAQALIYQGNTTTIIQSPGFAPGPLSTQHWLIAFEDGLVGGPSGGLADEDYSDFVALVESLVPSEPDARCPDDCNDGSECTDDMCVDGVCVHIDAPPGTRCGDPTSTECDHPDTCDGQGRCVPNHEVDWRVCTSDGIFCNGVEVCINGLCESPGQCCESVGLFCDEAAGKCICLSDVDCDDADDCTEDTCMDGICVHRRYTEFNECEDTTHHRTSTSKKGSLLVFPLVEIKWDRDGSVAQDTFLSVTNDFDEDVKVHFLFVNGDADRAAEFCCNPPLLRERFHVGWTKQNYTSTWTQNESTYFSMLTGQPKGAPPLANLDNGVEGPGRPDDELRDGTRILRGFVLAWAVDAFGNEITHNHLSGSATIISYRHMDAWEYGAYAFAAYTLTGQWTDGTPGQLLLNGNEYDYVFDKLLLDFYASGSQPFSSPIQDVMIDTDLTLLPMLLDLRQNTFGPVVTKARFDIWNQNEDFFSGTKRLVACWNSALLSSPHTPNHLLVGSLQTDKGKARINALGSSRICIDGTQNVPLLGVASKVLGFSGISSGKAHTAIPLVGQGIEAGRILADIPTAPAPLSIDR